jgi:putative transposase
MSYSIDLRERVLKFIENGGSKREACRVFSIGSTTLYKWLNMKALKGTLRDDPPKRNWKKIDPNVLLMLVEKNPDYILAEYAQHFGCSINSVFNALKRLKITQKKRPRSTGKGMKRSVPTI